MNIYERNVKVFKENRELAVKKYKASTDILIKNTKVYKSPLRCKVSDRIGYCRLEFDRNDTIATTLYLARKGYNVCALNFADALTPGGLVLQGEVTQEEDLCRCTNLYESLVKPECIEDYYKYNQSLNSSRYSDRIIYSENVSIIRESLKYSLLSKPVKCNIITCPAPIVFPNQREYYELIKNRIRGILKVAASNNNTAVVLGAWGCGAFGGDARVVGRAFAEALREFSYFDIVYFSVKSTINDSKDNLKLLYSGFESYNG